MTYIIYPTYPPKRQYIETHSPVKNLYIIKPIRQQSWPPELEGCKLNILMNPIIPSPPRKITLSMFFKSILTTLPNSLHGHPNTLDRELLDIPKDQLLPSSSPASVNLVAQGLT